MSTEHKPLLPRDGQFWVCVIGPVPIENIPAGGDLPPRMAARTAMLKMTGVDPVCSSGWGYKYDPTKRLRDLEADRAKLLEALQLSADKFKSIERSTDAEDISEVYRTVDAALARLKELGINPTQP